MQPSASSTSLIGYLLEDRYRIIREIGRGGMGVVYEAEHTELGKRVAIKLMLEKYNDDKEAVARFQREALAASRIGNPHIIDVSHIGTAPDGRPFVAMELLQGRPLGDEITRVGAMSATRAIAIMRQVLRAVGAAHAKGIVHRDLKPDNIYLVEQDDQRDFVKLLDFGISKMMDGEGAVAHTKLTTTGMVMGTPLYMAPEQAMGAVIDHQADIYALGVILYEMLSGRPPFEGATYPVLIAKLLTTEPTPNLKDLQPHLPARLIAATHKALEKDPVNRFESAEAFLAALPQEKSASHAELAGTVGIESMSLRAVATSTAQNYALQQPHAPVKRGAPVALIAAVAGVVVLGGAIGGYLALHKNGDGAAATASATPQPAPAPAPAADAVKQPSVTPAPAEKPADVPVKPTVGKLEIKSTPPGATVSVDKNPAGQTPLEIALGPGKHHIHLELAKFAAVDDDEDVVIGEKTSILIPMQAATGRVVGSAPPVRVVPQVQHTVVTPQTKPQQVPEPPRVEELTKSPPQTPPHDTTKPGTKPNPYD